MYYYYYYYDITTMINFIFSRATVIDNKHDYIIFSHDNIKDIFKALGRIQIWRQLYYHSKHNKLNWTAAIIILYYYFSIKVYG